MALDLMLLGATGVEAVAKLINYTFKTTVDPKWITATGAGSPFAAKTTVTVNAKGGIDAQGNPSPYAAGGTTITYNRVGFQRAFQGLNLMLHMQPPFNAGQIVAQLQTEYGIVLEQADIRNLFSVEVPMDAQGNVTLQPGGGSLRYYIDYSPFELKIAINTSVQTELQKLIALSELADMAVLNAANMPASHDAAPLTPTQDRAY